MARQIRMRRGATLAAALAVCVAGAGCLACKPPPEVCACPIPREMDKVNMPAYVIEPPDILLIDAVRIVPKPPYRIEPLDALLIQVPRTITFEDEPIGGAYVVDPDGTVNLGLSYGSVSVVGLTLPEAKAAVEKQLRLSLKKEPQATVALGQSRGAQQVRGEHLVRPDGTISLGLYGSVRVTGLTLPEAKAAVEAHLSQYLQKPEVAVDVFAYNSKVFYVIYDGGGNGQQVTRLPVTGNETVLDAVANLQGLNPVSSKRHIWVARPSPACNGCDQVMPVDWVGITENGRTETNYQLLPGDRIYVKADVFVTFDTRLARFIAPFERMFGFTLLGNGVVRALHGSSGGGTGNGSGF